MKHTLLALFVVAMLALSLQFAVAQDTEEEEVSNETREQAKIMTTSHGAKVRLLQLEYALQKQIMIAERIISKASEVADDFDDSELAVILEEMKEVKDAVGSADPGKPTEDAVQEFVDLKHDAVQLSQHFKNATLYMFSGQELSQIREGLKDGLQDELKQQRERVTNAIREHNSERIQSALRAMKSIDKDGLDEGIRNGTLQKEQIMDKIQEKAKELTSEQKREAAAEMKRVAEQQRERAEAAIREAQERFSERISERVKERLDDIRDRLDINQDLISKRLNITLDKIRPANGTGSSDTDGGGEE